MLLQCGSNCWNWLPVRLRHGSDTIFIIRWYNHLYLRNTRNSRVSEWSCPTTTKGLRSIDNGARVSRSDRLPARWRLIVETTCFFYSFVWSAIFAVRPRTHTLQFSRRHVLNNNFSRKKKNSYTRNLQTAEINL